MKKALPIVGLVVVIGGFVGWFGYTVYQGHLAQKHRRISSNNLKQFVLGIHNYHDGHGRLPPRASVNEDGQPLLSWRVLMLPFIGGRSLHSKFKLDEPWDSAHNKELLPLMPKVYKTPGVELPVGMTCYQAVVGENTVFPSSLPTSRKEMLTFGSVIDGLSFTAAIVETAPERAVIWTKPDDYEFDAENPLAGLRDWGGVCLVAILGGSVRPVPLDMPNKDVVAFFGRNDQITFKIPQR